MDSLKELEKQVERLLGEHAELKRKNRNLAARVKKLEKAGPAGADAQKLSKERDELRRRVTRLVTRLESLAGEES